MVIYNFQNLPVVPTGSDFINVILSKTQRKTPTEIHKSSHISLIRKFYMKKVKFTQQSFHEKISEILTTFPLLDDMHPFYSDLMNVLYDKDHYKLALGQMNNAKHLIDNLGKDYVRLLKYGDSLYRCKQLKRAALGRMCTIVKGLSASLAYLEQVRQHLSRLPAIDPNTRTLIVCGYPNVGKSSFLNKITRANVDVQPYAFTTKSLFVGHTDYKYLPWQVIDTPGILDHPLEDRNTIEMQSITALAHLHAAILFIIDISETCGYTIEEQVKLFASIKPLFVGKPLIVVVNKIDMIRPESLDPARWQLVTDLADPDKGALSGTQVIMMSNMTEEGVSNVKQMACDALLAARVERKMRGRVRKEPTGKALQQIHVSQPVARDEKHRPAFIPSSVLGGDVDGEDDDEDGDVDMEKEMEKEPSKQERAWLAYEAQLKQEQEEKAMWEEGKVPGMESKWLRERWDLKSEEWKYDKIPEIVDGKNIADYIDPEIMARLEELEMEEENRVALVEEEEKERPVMPVLDEEMESLIDKIKRRKDELTIRKRTQIHEGPAEASNLVISQKKRTADELKQFLTKRGMLPELVEKAVENVKERERSRSRSRGRKRERSVSASIAPDDHDKEGESASKRIKRSQSRARSVSATPKPNSGLATAQQVSDARRLQINSRKKLSQLGKKGESDRHIPNLKPKHLFTGKRGIGKNQRR